MAAHRSEHPGSNQTPQPKPGTSTISNQTRPTPESLRLASASDPLAEFSAVSGHVLN